MKSPATFFLLAFLAGPSFADVPRSPSPERYKDLYLNSAMTDPPVVEIGPVEKSDLPDWVLVGLSKYVGDVTVVKVMNIKDRSRVTIPSQEATELGFKIVEVKQDRNFIDDAVVTLKKGTAVGEVRFDPQFLVLKAVAGGPVAGKAGQPPTPGGQAPGNNRPPIPGRPTTNSTNNAPNAPPVPGAVPVPIAVPQNQAPPNGADVQTKRKRYVPRK